MQLSYTSFRVHTGYLRALCTYGNMENWAQIIPQIMSWHTYFQEISKYFRKDLKFSNPQFASNELVKTIWRFSYNSFMTFGRLWHFGKNYVDWNTQTESNLKSGCNIIYYISNSKADSLQIHNCKLSCGASTDSFYHMKRSYKLKCTYKTIGAYGYIPTLVCLF